MTHAVPHPTVQLVWGAGSVVLMLDPLQGRWTTEHYLTLTDPINHLIALRAGMLELVAPPTDHHQAILAYLFLALQAWVHARGGIVRFAPLRLQVRADTFREPDLLLRLQAQDPRRQNRSWLGADLVVELVSPDDPTRDTVVKRAEYAAGIPKYWIVYPEAATITVLALVDGTYTAHGVFGRTELLTSPLLPGLLVPVRRAGCRVGSRADPPLCRSRPAARTHRGWSRRDGCRRCRVRGGAAAATWVIMIRDRGSWECRTHNKVSSEPMPHPLARDTAPAAEARQIAFFQQRQPHERLAITCDLTAFAVAASRAAIRRAHPDLTALEHARLCMELQFGPAWAARVQQPPTIEGSMSIPAALVPLTRAFQQLNITYYVGGSIASTAYSLPRATYDIDLAADLQPRHVAPLIAALEPAYYIERAAVLDAIAHRDREASFNIMHHATGINLDIFVTAGRPFDRARYQRAQEHTLPGTSETIKLASPEDIILNKLLWFRQDGIESQKQWRDVQSIIRVQSHALDLHYLQTWAGTLQVRDLLDAALHGDAPPRAGGNAEPHQDRMF